MRDTISQLLAGAVQHPFMLAFYLIGGLVFGLCFFGMALNDAATSALLAQMEKR